MFVSVLHILGLESARLLLLLLLQFFLLVPQMEDSVVTFRKTLGQQRMEKKKNKNWVSRKQLEEKTHKLKAIWLLCQ